MQRGWCEAGGTIDGFWKATLRELAAFLRGANARRIADHNQRLYMAYWTARWGREKDMTDLSTLLLDEEGKVREATAAAKATTPADIRAAMEAWAQVSGGKINVEIVPKRKRRCAAETKGA